MCSAFSCFLTYISEISASANFTVFSTKTCRRGGWLAALIYVCSYSALGEIQGNYKLLKLRCVFWFVSGQQWEISGAGVG